MRWLENHLNLINTYSVALENLDNYRGDHDEYDDYVDQDDYDDYDNQHLNSIALWLTTTEVRMYICVQ